MTYKLKINRYEKEECSLRYIPVLRIISRNYMKAESGMYLYYIVYQKFWCF